MVRTASLDGVIFIDRRLIDTVVMSASHRLPALNRTHLQQHTPNFAQNKTCISFSQQIEATSTTPLPASPSAAAQILQNYCLKPPRTASIVGIIRLFGPYETYTPDVSAIRRATDIVAVANS